jgi:hypothetical protein
MAISAVSGLSAGSMNRISPIANREIRPQNYAVENESEVSDAFTQAMAMQGVNGITGPAPVQYPNAQVEENKVNAAEQSKQANAMFNKIASAYQGMNTSYNANGGPQSYGMVGNSIDLTA